MISQQETEALFETIIKRADAEHIEVLLSQNKTALSRFANNVIHQNLQQENREIEIKIIENGRMGKAATNNIDDSALDKTIARAKEAAKLSPPLKESLLALGRMDYQTIDAFDEETANATPAFRAKSVKKAFDLSEKHHLEAAGICSNATNVTALANNNGLFAYHPSTQAKFSLTAQGEDVSGWSEAFGNQIGSLDFDACVEEAVEGALKAQNPTTIEAGKYDVVLPPAAASDFLFFLAFHVFNGLAFEEGRSAFSGKLGEKLFGENMTIRDDAFHPLMKGAPFDYEGTPKQALTLVENGVAKAVCYDRATAKKAGKESTGHALPQPNPYGPIPFHLVIDGGDSALEEMIASTERGLFVTHFHYTNVINPMKQIITGMTRDGLFLIENGKITKPVNNLRFTESAFNAYSNVEALTKEQRRVSGGFGGGFVTPGMKIKDFSFTSSTEF